MPNLFSVSAFVDDHKLTATADTAKEVFAKAVEWHVVEKFADISISDGINSFTIAEFSLAMALAEIANTTKAWSRTDQCGSDGRG